MDISMLIVGGITLLIISGFAFGIVRLFRGKTPEKSTKTIKCMHCKEGVMVTSYTTKFNGWALIGAIVALGVMSYAAPVGLIVGQIAGSVAAVQLCVILWALLWFIVFCSNCSKVRGKIPTWVCEHCDFSYVKGSKQ